MKLSYKKRLFLYFLMVFTLFTVIIVMMQQNREKMYKKEYLRTNMDAYSEVISNYVTKHQLLARQAINSIQEILPLLPEELRVTIIDRQGRVLYDNRIGKNQIVEDHLNRPEISNALIHKSGSDIRISATKNIPYYYYARYVDPYFVRVAFPYNDQIKNTLKADEIFVYFILLLFFIALGSILYLSDRFGKAVSSLKDFIITAENNAPGYDKIKFPDTELGEIGNKIVTNYKLLEDSKNRLNLEREKLLRHFHYSNEGICIFSANHEKIYANTHFIQHLNTIVDEPTFEPGLILDEPDFKELKVFLSKSIPVNPQAKTIPAYQGKISKNGKHFAVRLLIFYDNSYEITLENISSAEQNRLLKQEMTNNIAHELKTPVSSIRGYIETLLEQDHIDPVKQKFFLERTYMQVLRLSDLIRDVALITKTEEASDLFEKETVNIGDTVREVASDLAESLKNHYITLCNQLKDTIEIEGNHTLLYSIFRNLIDNSIHYAGENITINIEQYTEDDEFYYFSYYDTGHGVDDIFLDKIFDRFFRINEGRSRKTGGSGLGLSIVKNAVLFHKGLISAKSRKEGGLEFIFSLRKKLR